MLTLGGVLTLDAKEGCDYSAPHFIFRRVGTKNCPVKYLINVLGNIWNWPILQFTASD